jgi:hypothetical protein
MTKKSDFMRVLEISKEKIIHHSEKLSSHLQMGNKYEKNY